MSKYKLRKGYGDEFLLKNRPKTDQIKNTPVNRSKIPTGTLTSYQTTLLDDDQKRRYLDYLRRTGKTQL